MPAAETVEVGRALLGGFEFPSRKSKGGCQDHELGVVAKACLGGGEGEAIAADKGWDARARPPAIASSGVLPFTILLILAWGPSCP